VCDKILVSAAILVHYVFRYPAVAHSLTHSLNLAFGLKSGFKNNVRLGTGSGFKMTPVYNCLPKTPRGDGTADRL